jgi:RNA-directed DNA polymerase
MARHPEAVSRSIQALNIHSLNDLAFRLGEKRTKLDDFAARAASFYRPYDLVSRPRPYSHANKAKPKPRHIDQPIDELKLVQQKIHRLLLRPLCFPGHICGAVRSRSILDNASMHLGAPLVVTIDIRQCFPSISNKQVYRVWRDLLGCSGCVAALLTRLTTFERHLPQGAPTSPLLANLFIWMIDEPIRALCADLGLVYSTWIDDLAFSGLRAREVIQPTISILAAERLGVSRRKVRVMGDRAVKLLTGTRLGIDRIRSSRELNSRVRSAVHKLSQGVWTEADQEPYLRGLAAQLRHIELLCPQDADTLRRRATIYL